MKLSLSRVAEWMGLGLESGEVVNGWSIDSRTLEPGDLFFALRGPRHDGHGHIAEAFGKGAIAAVVDREAAGMSGGPGGLPPARPVLRVQDVLEALGRLAARAREI